jgi:hypothetical protein
LSRQRKDVLVNRDRVKKIERPCSWTRELPCSWLVTVKL